MAEKNEKKKGGKRQKILLIVLGVVVIGTVIFFIFNMTGSPPPAETPGAATTTNNQQAIIPDIDFSVVESQTFQQFDVWNVLPVTVGQTGKDNPFGEGGSSSISPVQSDEGQEDASPESL